MKIKILLVAASVIVLISILGIIAVYKIGDIVIEKALEAELSNALSESNINNLYSEIEKGAATSEGEPETTTEKPADELTGTGSTKETGEDAESEKPNPNNKTNEKLNEKNNKKITKNEANQSLTRQ